MALFSVKNLSASYTRDGERVPIFSDVSFSLDKNNIYDLIGTSGAGKSTLLRACARLMRIDSGDMFLDGVDYLNFSPQGWRSEVALVPQTASLMPGSVKDNLFAPFSFKANEKKEKPTKDEMRNLLDVCGLADVELDRLASQLSGGQAARVCLIRTILLHPSVLLLDEVDSALDKKLQNIYLAF